MPGEVIPDCHHVFRYCKPGTVINGSPTARSFEWRETDRCYLSVNWVESLGQPDTDSALGLIRVEFGRGHSIKKKGRFLKVNVGIAKLTIWANAGRRARFNRESEHGSHSGLRVSPPSRDLAIGAAIMAVMQSEWVYPAVP